MRNTVIGFFRNSTDAYHAADILKDRGFDDSIVDVSPGYAEDENRSGNLNERTGKVGSFFKSLFSDNDYYANRYTEVAEKHSLVTVHANDYEEAERAADILDECGAINVDEGSGRESSAFTNTGTETSGAFVSDRESNDLMFDSEKDRDRDLTSEASIPIIEEEVNVGKREVRRGGVRVHSRIIEKPVEETLRLREERVVVERNPVDREASEADLEGFHDETIEVTEYGEEPIVSKRTRVVEEVKVGKKVHERQETIRDTKKKTEVDIENLEDETKRKSSDNRKI